MRHAPINRANVLSTGRAQTKPDLITFSHLRWNFVFQRPQHLMARFVSTRRVFFFEEPILHDETIEPKLEVSVCKKTGVVVVVPHLSRQLSRFANECAQKELLEKFCERKNIKRPVAWYYTPDLYCYSKELATSATIYDCMDELANFRFASPQLPLLERELMRRADIVFTGGPSLFEAKRKLHPHVHCFPSSVDRAHFATARDPQMSEPEDQQNLPHPRLGFYGVIDERIDLELVKAIAGQRPDWSIVMVGPVAKLSPDELPRLPNIHYLGSKTYEDLPKYLAGWDVALMPFALNEATRFISPTKTPEYLAGGKPVVSSPIVDVVRQFEKLRGVQIAQTSEAFIGCCEAALRLKADPDWLREADASLSNMSWDSTFAAMDGLIDAVVSKRQMEAEAAAKRTALRSDARSQAELQITTS